jgi:serine-type D-Ala-D-Ala carboxypeptidase/endopeptidase (penicillin-binding protein 4)
MIKLRTLFIIFAISNLACTPKVVVKETSALIDLKERITYLVNDPNLFNAQVGIYIESQKSGEIIYHLNEHKLFISASNMKMFTTATSLLLLGPDHRYKTKILTDAEVENNILNGDLIIRGSGDPSISARFQDGDVRNLMRAWADSLIALGITKVNGNLIGDASYFQNPPLGAGWQWDDEPFWYSAQINALSINDNCIDVLVRPGKNIGSKPVISLTPTETFFEVENLAYTAAEDSLNTLFVTRSRSQNKLIIKNEIPLNYEKYAESISVEDPAMFFVHIFAEILAEKGVQLTGKLLTNNIPDKFEGDSYNTLMTYYSPPLNEIVNVVNKRSQNLYAEQLLLTIAAEYGEQSTAQAGTKIVNETLARMGIPETEFRMQDGSGLARKNLISPYGTASLLRYMSNHRYADYFFDSLPIGGVDGTLRSRMKGMSAVGKVHAKTGYVGYARNLSGYVDSQDDERFIFSILVNNYTIPTPAINLLQDRICNVIAEFRR